MTVRLVSSVEIVRIAKTAGFDAIYVDLEHSAFSLETTGQLSVMVLIGTNDFLAALGHPGEYDHPKVREAYERTLAACRKHGKHVGVGGLGSRPDLVQQFVAMGARFVSTGTDLGFLLAACTERAKQVRNLKI
jgi:2-keto-3-deoxy-L-rhamnonate aldolase RhmA